LEFRKPEWIPCNVVFSFLTRKIYHEELEDIVAEHPLIFRETDSKILDYHELPPAYRENEFCRDNWGCLWHNIQGGLEGQVVENPLADWSAFNNYTPPDPMLKADFADRDWNKIESEIEHQKKNGRLTIGDGGRLFDRMYFLRGFENLMLDIATDEPKLPALIEMIADYEMKLIEKWLKIGVDIMYFHTDIGTQNSLMISPEKFRKYIKPMFKKLFAPIREAGTHIYLSSDGRLLEIVDDLVECGVSMHDPQFRANTLEGIAKAYKGKMCMNLDLDRQMFAFCTPDDLRDQIKKSVKMLDSPEGGLMITASIWDKNIPIENIKAICNGLEEFCFNR